MSTATRLVLAAAALLPIVVVSARKDDCDELGRPSDWRQAADDLADEMDPSGKWREGERGPMHTHPLEKLNGFSYEIVYGELLAPIRHKTITMLE